MVRVRFGFCPGFLLSGEVPRRVFEDDYYDNFIRSYNPNTNYGYENVRVLMDNVYPPGSIQTRWNKWAAFLNSPQCRSILTAAKEAESGPPPMAVMNSTIWYVLVLVLSMIREDGQQM